MTRSLVIGGLITSIVLNVVLLLDHFREVEVRSEYGTVEQHLINKSKAFWKQKEPRKLIEQQGRFPQVIHFSDRTCVSFELMPGGLGGVPIYCYNPSNDELIQRLDEVE